MSYFKIFVFDCDNVLISEKEVEGIDRSEAVETALNDAKHDAVLEFKKGAKKRGTNFNSEKLSEVNRSAQHLVGQAITQSFSFHYCDMKVEYLHNMRYSTTILEFERS